MSFNVDCRIACLPLSIEAGPRDSVAANLGQNGFASVEVAVGKVTAPAELIARRF